MNRVEITDQISTHLRSDLVSARKLDLDGKPLGEGAFGVVYRLNALDGKPIRHQVVKILTNTTNGADQKGIKTIRELQIRLEAEDRRLQQQGTSLLDRYPALLGVPQFSFKGMLDGKSVVGYMANDLTQFGMEDFGLLLEDDAKVRALQSLPLEARLELASQLVDAFDFLRSVNFLHADFKPEALFISLNKPACGIIDFDSGAVISNPSDKPTTIGTKQAWLAPEVLKQLDPGGKPACVQISATSDFWSVTMAVHHLLFGCHPLFFLKEVSDRSMRDYSTHFRWPDVDHRCAYFNSSVAPAHATYTAYLRANLPHLLKPFGVTFDFGYTDPLRRVSYGGWKMALAAQNRPEILSFAADRQLVKDTKPVRLSWEVRGSGRLELEGVANVTGLAFCDVQVQSDTKFRLILTPRSGHPVASTLQVTVSKEAPVIHSFSSDRDLLSDAKPVKLRWNVTGAECVTVSHGVGRVASCSGCDVLIKQDTNLILTATSAFGVVSTATLRIEVSKQKPKVAFFRASRVRLDDRAPIQLSWWVSSDATRVTITGIGSVPNVGSIVINSRQDSLFHLVATSAFGHCTHAQVSIEVSKAPPRIEFFHATPALVVRNDKVVLNWKVNGAETVIIEPGVGEVSSSGSVFVLPPGDTVYVVRARSYFGAESSRAVRVRVVSAVAFPTPATAPRPTPPNLAHPSTFSCLPIQPVAFETVDSIAAPRSAIDQARIP